MTERRPNPQPGSIIGVLICPCCSRQMPIKLDRNSKVYAYCANQVFELGAKKCGMKREFSFYEGQRIIQAYRVAPFGMKQSYSFDLLNRIARGDFGVTKHERPDVSDEPQQRDDAGLADEEHEFDGSTEPDDDGGILDIEDEDERNPFALIS